MGGYFRPCESQRGVCLCLGEVSTYRRLKVECWRGQIAGTTVWCSLMGGICLHEVPLVEVRLYAICNMEPSAFRDFASFITLFQCKNRLLKRISSWLIFVIQESEIFISVICDPLFFPFVNHFRDPPLPSLYNPLHRFMLGWYCFYLVGICRFNKFGKQHLLLACCICLISPFVLCRCMSSCVPLFLSLQSDSL